MELTPAEQLAYWQAAAENADDERRILRLECDAQRRELAAYVATCASQRNQITALQQRLAALAVTT